MKNDAVKGRVTAVGFALLAMLVLLIFTAANAGADTSGQRKHRRPVRVAAGPQLIVCGMTGCFEVPPGCRYEMRPRGRGLVAVIFCDKR